MTTPTDDEAIAPKITQASKPLRWYHWHVIIVAGCTIAAASDNANMLGDLLYLLPVNLLLFLPISWTISLLFRRK